MGWAQLWGEGRWERCQRLTGTGVTCLLIRVSSVLAQAGPDRRAGLSRPVCGCSSFQRCLSLELQLFEPFGIPCFSQPAIKVESSTKTSFSIEQKTGKLCKRYI